MSRQRVSPSRGSPSKLRRNQKRAAAYREKKRQEAECRQSVHCGDDTIENKVNDGETIVTSFESTETAVDSSSSQHQIVFQTEENSSETSNLKMCDDGSSLDLGNPKNLQTFLQNYRHLNELVIGKAMSYAAPGDRFEILLQPRHSL